jgi:hypothetical protein
MIFLEIPFFRHYVFAVVQKSSSPTHPGGNPPLIRYARVRASEAETGGRAVDMVDGTQTPPTPRPLHPAPCTLHPAPCTLHPAPCTLHPALHNRDGCATFKPHAIPSVEAATPIKIFVTFRVFSLLKNRLISAHRFSPRLRASVRPRRISKSDSP